MATDYFADIPKKVKVGTRTIPIETVDVDDGWYGLYSPFETKILLSRASIKSRSLAVETFWHELVHAVFDYIRFYNEMVMEMNDKDPIEQDAYKIEERVTESFAQTFLQVIHDNKLDHLNNK